jgi:hypothetical protein
VHAFNYLPVIFETLQPAELDDIALAMAALKAIRPQTAYDSEVLIYIATCAKISGMVYLPETLYPGVQPHLDGITFEYGLRDATKASWEGSQESSAEDVALQLGKLKEIQDYVAERL